MRAAKNEPFIPRGDEAQIAGMKLSEAQRERLV
jgi:hypothetical protein